MGTPATPAATAANPYEGKARQVGLNHVTLSGNLTHDPELKEPNGGPAKVCVLRLAVNGPIPRGDRKQRVDFFRIDVWGTTENNKRPEAQAKHLKKGRPITVTGRLRVDQPRDADGRISATYVTVVADQVIWHGQAPQQGTPDTVTAEVAGTPDTVAVQAPEEAKAEAIAAADPEPY